LPRPLQHLAAQIKAYNPAFGADFAGKKGQIQTGTAPKIQYAVSGAKPQPLYGDPSIVAVQAQGKEVNHRIIVAGAAIIE